jgi:hypothetical protein
MFSAVISKGQYLPAVASLFIGLTGSSLGAVRFDVVGSPTEVINTGRSEVLGSVNLVARGAGNITGTSAGGAAQIGLIFSNPALQIDNTPASGIRLITSPGFAAASPAVVLVENIDVNGHCAGFVTINLLGGIPLSEGDFLRLEGIRGRIDASAGLTPGTDLFVDLQSINDPTATSFTPDRVRVAKSLKGLNAEVLATGASFEVRISEGFARAFVDRDAGDNGVTGDRVDSTAATLGDPTNSTRFLIRMTGIPDGISGVLWPATSPVAATGAVLRLLDSEKTGPVSTATYSYETVNQVSISDIVSEAFSLTPGFEFTEGRCRFDGLSTAVTLAPAVPAASGCSAPSAEGARPRFLEAFEVSIGELSPASAVVRGPEFILTVRGSGFVQGSTVQWNGEDRATTFVDNGTLTAVIPAADILKVGKASITIVGPDTLGGFSSPAREFSITPPSLSLYYPRLVATDSTEEGPQGSEFTGIALANVSGRVATLKLTAFNRDGTEITGAGITNPATLRLNAGQQLPLIDAQIFGSGFRQANSIGWLRLEGDVAQVVGFFLGFNGNLTELDGADVSAAVMSSLVLPEIESRGFNQIHIANPNDEPVTIAFELIQADGSRRGAIVSRTLQPNGALVEQFTQLFPGISPISSDYIRATASNGVVPFEYLGRTARDVQGLNGQDASLGATTLYSPQYVVGGSEWQSSLSIVNVSDRAGNVSLRFVGDDGVQMGSTRILPIAPRGKIRIDDPDFFVDSGDTLRQGYVVVSSDGPKLTGAVVFGNPGSNPFSAALPLVSGLQSRMVFGQVASNETFFTGLSIFNPEDDAARTVIQVFDHNGNVIASKIETIPAKGRRTQLLTQYFPELVGRSISSGYITVSSIRNLAAFALFGANNLSVLSAVPAQVVP